MLMNFASVKNRTYKDEKNLFVQKFSNQLYFLIQQDSFEPFNSSKYYVKHHF